MPSLSGRIWAIKEMIKKFGTGYAREELMRGIRDNIKENKRNRPELDRDTVIKEFHNYPDFVSLCVEVGIGDAEIGELADLTFKNDGKKNDQMKVGRNQPCPCGSGKKYKRCCGR